MLLRGVSFNSVSYLEEIIIEKRKHLFHVNPELADPDKNVPSDSFYCVLSRKYIFSLKRLNFEEHHSKTSFLKLCKTEKHLVNINFNVRLACAHYFYSEISSALGF